MNSIKFALYIFTVFWFIGIFIDFFLPFLSELIYADLLLDNAYSLVCHQDSSKLITFNGYSTKVCARCTGIYFGAFLSSLILIFVSINKSLNVKFLLWASVPMIADVILYNVRIYSYSKIAALITGLLFGSICFLYIAYGIDKFIEELKKTEKLN